MDITHKPFKELIIMEITRYPKPEALAGNLSLAVQLGQPAALLWCDGVLFIPVPLPPETEVVAEQYLRGKITWSSVLYTLLPSFQQTIKVSAIEVPIIDVSPNPIMKQVAGWLKKRAENSQASL